MRSNEISESEMDEGASMAESYISATRVRRNEAERIAYFHNQPDAEDVQPGSVTCTRCKKIVPLGKKTTYEVRPWEKHRESCDAKPKSLLWVSSSYKSD